MTWLENLSNSISAANISLSIGPHPLSGSRNGLSEVVNAPIQWGFITGFVLSTYLHYLARHWKWLRHVQDTITACALQVRYGIKLIGSLIVAILFAPLAITTLFAFYVYRKALEVYLKNKYADRFGGLLDGHDAHWVLEDAKCKSVINVMCTFQGVDSSAEILMALRKRLAARLLGKHQPHPKLFYRRIISGGFAFWTKVFPSEIFIEDFIRLVDIPSKSNSHLTMAEMKNWIGKMYNADLPKDHTSSWEILVSKKALNMSSDPNVTTTVYPVLFRVHHSLGDGIALMRFVLDTIADKKSTTADLWQKGQKILISNREILTILRNSIPIEDLARLEGRRRHSLRVEINMPTLKARLKKIFSFIRLFYQCPLILNEQLVLRPIDSNSLHHPAIDQLTEEKFVDWFIESDKQLFGKIRGIKAAVPGVTFSDVLLTALSTSLHQHFVSKRSQHKIPKEITMVMPMRMGPLSPRLELSNRFSVGLQSLPISPPTSGPFATKEVAVANIKRTNKKSQELLHRFDLLINYWILGTASALIPIPILGPMVRSKHCTMVLSNLPGPKEEVTIGKATLKDLSFWLPNKGSTGLGLTLITYQERVQIGIGGDETVLDDYQGESKKILNGIVAEINRMYELCC